MRADSSGGLSWHTKLLNIRGVSTYPNGDVLVCGNYSGTPAVDDFTLPTAMGSGDVWIARYSPTGTLLWSRRHGGQGFDGRSPRGVSCGALDDGSYILAARTDDNFDIGSLQIPGTTEAVVIAKVDNAGNGIWGQRTTGDAEIVAIEGRDERIALILSFSATTGLTTSHASAGGSDIYVGVLAQ